MHVILVRGLEAQSQKELIFVFLDTATGAMLGCKKRMKYEGKTWLDVTAILLRMSSAKDIRYLQIVVWYL